MKQYWSMAIALAENKPQLLFTYDSCLSVAKCNEVFKKWQDECKYTLLSTWIQVTDDDKPRYEIEHKVYVNSMGQVKKI